MAQSKPPGENYNPETDRNLAEGASPDYAERLTRHEVLMDIASTLSKRGTCRRKSVGAVLAKDGRVISSGYVGAPSGEIHCHPDICNPEQPCTRTVHAEANCVAFAARHGVATIDTTLYTTLSPCIECAKLLINAGIEMIVYRDEYRDTAPLILLESIGVEVWKYDALLESQV